MPNEELKKSAPSHNLDQEKKEKQEKFFRDHINKCNNFDEIYNEIKIIYKSDRDFCKKMGVEETIREIQTIEALNPEMLLRLIGVTILDRFKAITHKYGLRDKIIALTRIRQKKVEGSTPPGKIE